MTARTPDPVLFAQTLSLTSTYGAYETTGENLVARLREYAEDYSAAGLVERWDDVANDRMDIEWTPGTNNGTGAWFRFTDCDGDTGTLFLPFAYLLNPTGYIAQQVQDRQEKEEETERLHLAEEAAARPARIARLRAELAELSLEQEPEQR